MVFPKLDAVVRYNSEDDDIFLLPVSLIRAAAGSVFVDGMRRYVSDCSDVTGCQEMATALQLRQTLSKKEQPQTLLKCLSLELIKIYNELKFLEPSYYHGSY